MNKLSKEQYEPRKVEDDIAKIRTSMAVIEEKVKNSDNKFEDKLESIKQNTNEKFDNLQKSIENCGYGKQLEEHLKEHEDKEKDAVVQMRTNKRLGIGFILSIILICFVQPIGCVINSIIMVVYNAIKTIIIGGIK